MKIKKIFILFIIASLVLSILAGCANNDVVNIDETIGDRDDRGDRGDRIAQGQPISAEQLATLVREGEYESDFVFDPPLHGVERTQSLIWEINFDPAEKGFDDLSQLMNVYTSSDLKISVNPIIEFDAEKGALIISPDTPNPTLISHQHYCCADYWGHQGELFAVRYYSVDGERLDRPVVFVFTIANELEAPFVNFSVRDGFASFKWNPVPGATEYHFYRVVTHYTEERGYYYSTLRFWITEETGFTYELVRFFGTRHFTHNMFFHLGEGMVEYSIVAVAVNGDTVSQFSNVIHSDDIAPLLPFMLALEDDYDHSIVTNVSDVSVFRRIKMCDNSLVKMPVYHHIDEAEVFDGNVVFPYILEPGEGFALRIPFTVMGINLRGYVFVNNYECPDLEQELLNLKEREHFDGRGGMLTPSIERATGDEVIPDEPAQLYVGEFRINASNPLSEFLAINMINGAEHVDLRAFPEAADSEFLIAAWQEAVHQNPMVLKVRGISWNRFGDLFIEYGQTREEQQRQQAAIMAEVRRIVSEIITDDMTDLEKQLAINNYLVETATYDFAALENAEQYDFLRVDSRYYDSFTAYGVLINGVGVCSSYAYAFRLLADEAGLRNVVVTGHMFGTLPHAWNRVYIDGEWLTLDVTNNDDDYMRNIFFNLPDHVAETVLVEDNRFSMSGINYASRTYDMEYYRLKGMFYYPDEIVAAIIRDLSANGYVMLRTDYTLTEAQFLDIVAYVVELGDFNINNMTGGMMLGVIYLSVEG